MCEILCDFYARQGDVTKGDKKAGVKNAGHRKAQRFLPVLDSRKRKVRGLVQRNGKCYAQMRVTMPGGTSRAIRHPLTATRLDDAVSEAEKARTEKRSGEIHLPGLRHKFVDFAAEYLGSMGLSRESKKATRDKIKRSLGLWIEHL